MAVPSRLLMCAVLLVAPVRGAAGDPAESLVRYVNPFIGTDAHGHTYPGATAPFGMVQLSPDAGRSGWDWCSGYHYSDTSLIGFSHTHLSGTGCADLGDILFTPGTSEGILDDRYRSPYSHADETALPGYYTVFLRDSRITVELTATTRAGFHRYTFPATDSALIAVNLGYGQDDITLGSSCVMEGDSILTGWRLSNGWAARRRVYFAARFSKPVLSVEFYDDGVRLGTPARGKNVKALLRFSAARGERILAKVGISAVSIAGALENLDGEISGWDFDMIRRATSDAWEKELRKIRIQSADEKKKTAFYTALYHTMLAPTVYADIDNRYRGVDDSVHVAAGFINYSTFSLWDTFRAAHPLYTIMHPDRVTDMIRAMLAFAKEGGHLPVWPLAASETNTMIGYHAVPVIADAILKGIRGFDVQEAYRNMKKSAIRDHRGLKYYAPSIADLSSGPVDVAAWPEKPVGIVLNGYASTVAGDTIGYHSAHPDVRGALVVRATDGTGAMTWKTAVVPPAARRNTVTFAWLAGTSVGKGGHRFDLSMNGEPIASFNSGGDSPEKKWSVEGPGGARLMFRASAVDWFGDMFGTMLLTVPSRLVIPGVAQELRVTGQKGGSPDWTMTFTHSFVPRMTLSNEFGLITEGGETYQVVRADIEQLGPPRNITINAGGAPPSTAWIAPGLTTVRLRIPAVGEARTMTVSAGTTGSPELTASIRVTPVRAVGYVPADKEPESVSKTLEYAYDDWCIAQVAKSFGYKADEATFMGRARYYRNLYDSSTGFMRGRNLDGSWRIPFNPRYSTLKQPEYTEGNAWQYTWFVPHDVRGLMTLMGGKEKFVKKLDSLFNQSSALEGTGAPSDVSGLIGLYAHGNEPSHHIAYLYDYAGVPWKTQELVRRILRTMYGAEADGLCGNEDCGQMSSWYVMSSLGFYPVNPADGTYVIGSPALESATIDVGGGRTFTVKARNATEGNPYIQSVTLNGAPLERTYIRHAELLKGGTLEFVMGRNPNAEWGTAPDAAPPSMSD